MPLPAYDRNIYYLYENIVGDKEVIQHKIHMPNDIKGGLYWQSCSIDAFRMRLVVEFSKSHYRQRTGLYIQYSGQWTAMELDDDFYERTGRKRPCYSVVEHDSVWSFYKTIGYDHKDRSSHKKFFVRR